MNGENAGSLMILPTKERMTLFLAALDLKLSLNLSDPSHVEILKAAYNAFWPLVEDLRLRHLKDEDLDGRFIEIIEYRILPWHRIYSQHPISYWTNLRSMGVDPANFPEIGLYRTRRSDLVQSWKNAYSKKRKKYDGLDSSIVEAGDQD